MELSPATLKSITKQIENSDLEDGWSNDQEFEVQQGSFIIFVTYKVLGEFVKEYNYHSEVLYNCYENMSHTDFVDAEITNIEAMNEDTDEPVEIENLKEVKYLYY